MSDTYETVGAIRRACARGCTTPRQHETACPDRDECAGCLPRQAEFGNLCFPCHKRLENLVKAIPGQYRLLLIAAHPSGEQRLSQETQAKIGDGWRTDDNQRHQGPYARHVTVGSEGGEPIRSAATDAAQAVSDWLAQTVERIVDDYQARGPQPLRTQSERDGAQRLVWKSASAGYRALVTHGKGKEAMSGEYVWTDPPARFDVHTGTEWLLAQLERLEWDEDIADIHEQFADVMSQAHALAPWREQVTKLPGIPCRRCHRVTLVRFGGDEHVTCLNQRCREVYTPGQYAIWTRMLAEERGNATA